MGVTEARPESKAAAPQKWVRRRPRNTPTSKRSGVGVVRSCVEGHDTASTAVKFAPSKLVAALQEGLPFRELEELQTRLSVVSERLAPMLGISKATFHRLKGDDRRLSSAVSDRVVRYARLLGLALKVFGNLADAKCWLNSPQFGLGGAVPLDYAKTEIGAREVENLLGRIEYGVYS